MSKLADEFGLGAGAEAGQRKRSSLAEEFGLGGVKPSKPGIVRSAADTATALAGGAVTGAQQLANVAGADNPIAQTLGGGAKAVRDFESPARRAEREQRAAKIQQAEDSGSTWEEVKANVGAFAEAPIDTTVEAIGTSLPTIAAAALTRGRAPAITGGAVGALQGAGAVKGSIYDAVEQEYLKAGASPEEAAARAAEAQAYSGENLAQIGIGAGLGGVAGSTGVEGAVARLMSREAGEAAAQGVLRSALTGAAKEAPLEAVQGGQERLASNLALQNEGFDTPTWQGVAGSAALEGVAGAAAGGGFSAVEGMAGRSDQQPTSTVELGNEPSAAGENSASAPLDESVDDPSAPPVVDDAGAVQAPADRTVPPAVLEQFRLERPFPTSRAEAVPLSQQMGLDPSAGPMSSAAALAVDSGATQQLHQQAVLQEAAKAAEQGSKGAEQVDQETGEITQAQGDMLAADPATELQTRLEYVRQQARAGGWDARLVAERDRLLAELDKLQPPPAAAADQLDVEPPPAPADLQAGIAQAQANAAAAEAPADIRAVVAKQVPQMTDVELQQAIDHYGPDHKRTAKLQKELAKRGTQPEQEANAGEAQRPSEAQTEEQPAQAAPAPEAAPAEAAPAVDAGARWAGMSQAERQALAEQTDIKPVIRRNLPRAQWESMNPDVQRRLAERMKPQQAAKERADGTTEVLDKGMTIVHGSGNPSMQAGDIQIVRASGQKQGKAGRIYGGFYGTSEADAAQAEGYAGMMGGTPTLYDVKVKPGTKVLNKTGDITRLSEAYINELVSQGYGVVTGKDPRGRTEHVVIDKNAVESMAARRKPAEQQAPSIEGKDIGDGWAEFSRESGTAGIPRADMPQIKAEHRGAMTNFLNARGVQHQEETVPAASLKPAQAEFSREKVARAKSFEGGSRSILVSSDGHVLDGHHQWLAARDGGEDVKVIRLDAPIRELVDLAREFPSSTVDESSTGAPADGQPERQEARAPGEPAPQAQVTARKKPKAERRTAQPTRSSAETLPEILTTPKKRYIERQAKAAGLKKGAPGYDQAVQRLQGQYEADVDRASASLTFEQYNTMNSDSPERLNRQAWEALQQEFGQPKYSRASQRVTNSPEFERWFGDSKVVGENGEPMVVYHGTRADFDAFAAGAIGSNIALPADAPRGFYFAKSQAIAERYASGDGANVMPVFVSVKNPAPSFEQFNSDVRYDGFINSKIVVARNPEQIKSAIGNSGSFDPSNPDIRYSFAGRNAQGADRLALETARQRIVMGEDAEAVRQDTGWHRGADGRWRFEISDDQARIAVAGSNAASIIANAEMRALDDGRTGATVGDVLDHQQLFAAYPSLRDLPLRLMPADSPALARLQRRPVGFAVQMQGSIPRNEMASPLIHELQHAIQNIEGFALGGSRRMFASDLDTTGAETYRRLAGEVEARNVQMRMRMTPGLRQAIAPEATADVPSGEVLVTFNGTDLVGALQPQNITGRPPMTAQGLVRAFDLQFPKLTKAVRTMLQRGQEGKRGGLVFIDSPDPLRIAGVFSRKTGTSLSASVQLFEDKGRIQGFYDAKSGLTFLVGPNLDPVTGPAVLLHEMTHGQQREKIDRQASNMLMNRASAKSADLRAFLDRVAARMVDAGETANPREAAAYIVEQAVIEGREQGFGQADSRFLGWVDQAIGKPVGDFLRSVLAMVRQWMLRHGMPIGQITVGDLVDYAMAGVQQAAAGDVRGEGVSLSQDDLQKARILQGPPVSVLRGDEAPRGMAAVREWATKLFKEQGGLANNPDLGAVVLDGRAVRDSLGHGKPNPYKYAAFAAVKEVLERGALVHQASYKGGESFYVSAPVVIDGMDDIVTVLVRREPSMQRMYLHSVATKGYLLSRRGSGADADAAEQRTGSSGSEDVASVLQRLLTATLDSAPGDGPQFSVSGQRDIDALRKLGLAGSEARNLLDRVRNLTLGGLQQTVKDWSVRSEEGIFDGLAGIRRAEAAVGVTDPERQGYVSARMASGIADVMHGVLHYAAPEWRDGVVSGKAGTRGVLEILGDLGPDNLTPWLAWLGGKRAELLKAQGRENNLNDEEIAELQAMGLGKEELFERVYREYAQVNEAVLDLAQEAGLIDQGAREKWLTDYYVPFYRQDEAEGIFAAPRSKRGLSHQTAAIKALKGGTLPTNDLLANMLAGWTKRIDASMKNKALLEVVDNLKDSDYLADESPRWQQVLISRDQIAQQIRKDRKAQALAAEMLDLPNSANLLQVLNKLQSPEAAGFEQLWTRVAPTDPDIIRVQRDGKSEYYRVNDESLLRGLKFMEGSVFNDPITRIGRAFKRVLTTGVTASPDFILRNFIRDAAHAWMINKDGFKLGTDSIRGMRDALREDQDYRDLMFAGGSFQGGYVHGADPEASAQIIRRALEKKGFTRAQQEAYLGSLVNTPAKAAAMLGKGWQRYRELGDKVENANRLSTYKAALAAGKGRRQASFEAKDLMDYSLRGNFAAAQWFTDVVPFLNARLQGLYKLGRAVKGDKTLLAKEVAMKGAYIALFSLLLAGINDDDERYQALQDWDKDMHWHIFLGDEHFRIPKPFELGLLFGTVPERLLHTMTGSQDGGDLAKAVSQGVFQTLAFNPVPQFYQPIRELQANRNFFRDSPIEDMSDEGKLAEARYDERTSAIGYGLGQVTGRLAGISPKQVDHLIQGYTGTLGGYVLAASSLVANLLKDGERPALRAADLPVAKVIYQGNAVTTSKYQAEFYDMVREADQLQRTINSYREEGRLEAAAGLLESSRERLRHRPALGAARRQLGQIRNQIDAVYRDPVMTGGQKRQRLDELQRQANATAERVVKLAGADF